MRFQSSNSRTLEKWCFKVFITALLCLSPNVHAEQWTLWRDRSDITIKYRETADHLDEIRAETDLATSLSAFVNLFHDTDHAGDWISQVKWVKVLEQPSPTEDIVETRFKGFLLVRERWTVTYSKLSQDDDGVLKLTVNNLYRDGVTKPGVQIRYLKATWTLTPLQSGEVHIRYQGVVDPDGMLPDWLVHNRGLQVVYDTFVSLRKQLKLPRYQTPVPFVVEPNAKPAH